MSARAWAFSVLRGGYRLADRVATSLFGSAGHQTLVRISYATRKALFPDMVRGQIVPQASQPVAPLHWLPPPIPDWVIAEMKALGKEIDPAIYPTEAFLAACHYYSFPVVPGPGKVYWKWADRLNSDQYSYCFAIPWLKRGGADLVALRHIALAAQLAPGRVLVLMTEPGDSPWRNRLPDGVDVIDVADDVPTLSHDHMLEVLARLIVQLRPTVLHIMNSRHVWELVERYGKAITQATRVYASVYCDDYDRDGVPVGYGRQFLGTTHSWLTEVFTDNEAYVSLLRRTYGYPASLFRVLRTPLGHLAALTPSRRPEGRRVLWAGRLDRQKRPDLLLGIARAMPEVTFDVYGDTVLESDADVLRGLNALPNVRQHGAFDGVESLPFSSYPCFLYTSQWDGMPTMIVAAALSAIPIVASAVGGVSDIVTPARGYPIDEVESVASYVAAIRTALDNPEAAQAKADAARRFVRDTYTDDAFEASLRSASGYIGASTQCCAAAPFDGCVA